MLLKLLLALGLLVLLFVVSQKLKKMPPEQKRGYLLKALLIGIGVAVLVGVITGRMHWLGAVIAGLLPLLKFGSQALFRLVPFWMHQSGGVASFTTDHLEAQVHIQTGRVSGTVLKGPHAGARIEDLSSEDLKSLVEYYKTHDTRSYYLLKIGRPGPQFQQQAHGNPPPSFGNPSREEALQILGLTGNPSREDIIGAHRRLINKLHPDRGGSDFLAARVNQARDTLLEGK